jgi:thiamine pyrophosphate-dependent acetolactate synthase large subunit-like protein
MLGGLAEFTSAVQNNIDLIVMVLNDGTYGAEHIQFRRRDMDPGLSTFNWPELAPLAQALGGAGVTVRSVADFDAVADAVQHRDRPLLIDIKLDPDQVPYAG